MTQEWVTGIFLLFYISQTAAIGKAGKPNTSMDAGIEIPKKVLLSLGKAP
jgi:hypothetical protein